MKELTIDINAERRRVTCYDGYGHVGVARCHPDDRFDEYTGIMLAVKRCREAENGDNVLIRDFELENGKFALDAVKYYASKGWFPASYLARLDLSPKGGDPCEERHYIYDGQIYNDLAVIVDKKSGLVRLCDPADMIVA